MATCKKDWDARAMKVKCVLAAKSHASCMHANEMTPFAAVADKRMPSAAEADLEGHVARYHDI